MPGFKNMPTPEKVLITRSPYTEGSDVVLLKLITEESQLVGSSKSSSFDFLSNESFGTVTFPGGTPSPVSEVNSSDLDGDKFVAIWDPEIVREAETYTANLSQLFVGRVPSPEGMLVTNHRHTDKGIELQCEHDGKSVWQSISAVDEKFAVFKYLFKERLGDRLGVDSSLWFEIVQDTLVMNRSKDINDLVKLFSGLWKNAVRDPNLGPDSEKGTWHSY